MAREFDIPRIYGNWEDLIADPEVDAVVIGAWPYLHCPVTLAALDAGKHVLTEARMAMNAREAQRMCDHSQELPLLTAMVVPSPYGLTGDAFMRSLIASGWLGTLREVHVHGLSDQLADKETPLGWRQMTRYSGFNMLNLGILYETVLRWAAPANRVLAYASKVIPHRLDPEQAKKVTVGTPDSVQVLTTQEDGSCGVYRLSGVVWHENSMGVALYGSRGTLIYDLRGTRSGRPAIGGILEGAADPRVDAGRLAGRGGFHRGDSRRAAGDAHRLPDRRPLHAVHRGGGPQLEAPGPGHAPAPRVLQPQPLSFAGGLVLKESAGILTIRMVD